MRASQLVKGLCLTMLAAVTMLAAFALWSETPPGETEINEQLFILIKIIAAAVLVGIYIGACLYLRRCNTKRND